MAGEDTGPLDPAGRREQPFLYSWNRRMRHLHGISLRNLNIAPATNRSRGKTITDDEYNLATPAKQFVANERLSIQASKSFTDLFKSDKGATKFEVKKSSTPNFKNAGKTVRPGASQLRRRSTLHWAGASPRARQQKLEDVAVDRVVDTWFSIHLPNLEGPVYISEIMHKSMNPSFSNFDLDAAAAPVSRSDSFELKVWAKNGHMRGFRLLVDLNVNLRSLQFIGKTLENFHHPLPENCIVFHLSDGVYTVFADLPADVIHEPQIRSSQKSIPPSATSSYDALMKLANLDDCIQDALQTRHRLEADINAVLAQSKQEISDADVQAQREKVKATRAALEAERNVVESLSKQKAHLERSRDQRRHAMEVATQAKQDSGSVPDNYSKTIQALHSEVDALEEKSRGQIRRICENIQIIFPIDPIKNRTLQFTIRGIHLPNSVFDDTNRDEIAAALGFASQLVHQLSMYLSIPLPYEIEANASSSFINDNVSLSLAQRRYPLHPTNVNYKFEYGVFLLNKDIEFLMNRVGLRVLDIRHTLPNLKYLLFVLTAGTGDLPARKVGGVRGLLAGVASPGISRRNSEDSMHSRQGSTDYANGGYMNASARESREREKSPDDAHDLFTGSGGGGGGGRVKGLPYRRSLLREAG